MDPRFYQVTSPAIIPENEERYPFLYPYAKAIPENGQVVFLDSGWMESAVRKKLRLEITKDEYKRRIRMVNEFERHAVAVMLISTSEEGMIKYVSLKLKKKPGNLPGFFGLYSLL